VKTTTDSKPSSCEIKRLGQISLISLLKEGIDEQGDSMLVATQVQVLFTEARDS